MAKERANESISPSSTDYQYQNSGTMTQEDRESKYNELNSADDPMIEVGTTQIRGEASGMVPIRNKPIR